MSYSRYHDEVVSLYKSYNKIIKPLIAEIEVRCESFPQAIYNEIRAFNDHIARCYNRDFSDDDFVKLELFKAKGHIERIILDCYKFLNVFLYKYVVEKFDKRTKNIDLSLIGNGDFYLEYKKGRQFIIKNLKKAKLLETSDKEKSLEYYQQVHNEYSFLEELIEANDFNIIWAKTKQNLSILGKILLWLLSAIISGVISSSIIPWDKICSWVLEIIF